MPSKYFPFDSTFTGVDSNGISQGDRGASSADWAAYVSRMFTDGYFRLLDGQLEPSISAIPMAVDIASGAAMIKGRQYSQDETVTVSLGLSDSLPRIDRIVLRMSTEAADRNITLKVLKGTPAASPMAPAFTRTASVYDICLAQIAVGANAIQIIEDNLTDTRDDEALCGYVKILLDGRYYPDSTIPELLWVYTMYPETLTPEQKAAIEGDAALMGIYEASSLASINKIGTFKQSYRTDLSSDWALCNGAIVDQALYPDLYDLLRLTPDGLYTEATGPNPASNSYSCYENGYYVRWNNNSSTIYFRNSLTAGGYSSKVLPGAIASLKYINGYWIAKSYATSSVHYYCTTLDGTWSTTFVISADANALIVAYGEGVWAAVSDVNGSVGGIWTSPTLSVQSQWTRRWTGVARNLFYKNSKWMIEAAGSYYYWYWTASLINSPSLTGINTPAGTSGNGPCQRIGNTQNDYYSSSQRTIYILDDDISKGFTKTYSVSDVVAVGTNLYFLTKVGDMYVGAVGQKDLVYAYSLIGPWFKATGIQLGSLYVGDIFTDGGTILVPAAGDQKIYKKNKTLPIISGINYTYIKVK